MEDQFKATRVKPPTLEYECRHVDATHERQLRRNFFFGAVPLTLGTVALLMLAGTGHPLFIATGFLVVSIGGLCVLAGLISSEVYLYQARAGTVDLRCGIRAGRRVRLILLSNIPMLAIWIAVLAH